MSRWRAAALVALITLAGCAVQPPGPEEAVESLSVDAWQAPARPAAWTLSGRVSLQIDDDAGTATVRWRESRDGYRLDLRGALGAGRIRLIREDQAVTLMTADGERHVADNAAELVRAFTGYALPVGFLRWWVTGQPVPWLGGEVDLDAEGRAVALRQGEWRVRYADATRRDGYLLPGRVEVRRGDGVRVRLIIREWQLDE